MTEMENNATSILPWENYTISAQRNLPIFIPLEIPPQEPQVSSEL